ncbi:nanos homolog 3 [Pelobates fuscus]|uniref:nanos homolog 3 n=1 Tax=Pelobates fuscus TaxID=191477 RepID=UPI002FE4F2F2
MEPFDMWKDYLELNKLVTELAKKESKVTRRDNDNTVVGTEMYQQPLTERSTDVPTVLYKSLSAHRQPACPDPAPRDETAFCTFCKHNGESKVVYTRHRLKDENGRVECPILRCYVCPQCGATGKNAHTRRFCPLTEKGYTSVYQTARNSTGKKSGKGRGHGIQHSDSE